MRRIFLCLSLLAIGLTARAAEPSRDQAQFFEARVRPLLVAKCYECHAASAKKVKGGLLLDTRAGVRKGGESGAVIVAGQPDKSSLIRAVRYGDPELQMPPDAKLSRREIDVLVEWVRQGAPDPRDDAPAVATTAPDKPAYPEAARKWWSFQPVRPTPPPAVRDASWVKTDVDRFVLAKLEAHGLSPAPSADRRTLIRRVTFDLTGLPPAPPEVDAFLADASPDAYAKVVERLLASRAYGERWGRHWLDVVRYADTSGCNSDFPIPDAWRYRNYVIDSFNADKPYDRFVREQIAGDLLPDDPGAPAEDADARRYERIIATTYLPLSRRFSSVAEEFHLTLDDTIDNVGKAFLGLTVSCARCHDHKFDPIPQSDYYALYGIFQSTTYAFPGTEIYRHRQNLTPLVPREKLEGLAPILAKMRDQDARMYEVYSRVETLDTGKEKEAVKAKFAAIQKERDELLKTAPEYPTAFAATEGIPADARVQLKGDPKKPGAVVPRGFLQILGGQKLPADERGSGRLELAHWLTEGIFPSLKHGPQAGRLNGDQPFNPLTARVMVNRIWLHHFGGRGLVRTPDDFGTRGAPPTHPELLDFLADRFVKGGWSVKAMHRLICGSATYQQACVENAAYSQQDPTNELLWTYNRRRLSAEEVRDAMLAVSGALDRSPGGPHPFKPEVAWRYSQHNPFVDDFKTDRRSVYLMQQRIRQQPYLGTFDGADTNAVTGLRRTDTPPQQALFMLNAEFAHRQARLLADRLAKEAGPSAEGRVRSAYLLALDRPATSAEVEEALAFVRSLREPLKRANVKDVERSAWASYLRVLLSGNEFMFVE
jgi:hypothetical protein